MALFDTRRTLIFFLLSSASLLLLTLLPRVQNVRKEDNVVALDTTLVMFQDYAY